MLGVAQTCPSTCIGTTRASLNRDGAGQLLVGGVTVGGRVDRSGDLLRRGAKVGPAVELLRIASGIHVSHGRGDGVRAAGYPGKSVIRVIVPPVNS